MTTKDSIRDLIAVFKLTRRNVGFTLLNKSDKRVRSMTGPERVIKCQPVAFVGHER